MEVTLRYLHMERTRIVVIGNVIPLALIVGSPYILGTGLNSPLLRTLYSIRRTQPVN